MVVAEQGPDIEVAEVVPRRVCAMATELDTGPLACTSMRARIDPLSDDAGADAKGS
jgi:hypothetical protein